MTRSIGAPHVKLLLLLVLLTSSVQASLKLRRGFLHVPNARFNEVKEGLEHGNGSLSPIFSCMRGVKKNDSSYESG